MSTPEGAVKRAIHEYLLWHGWLVIRINQGARVTENEHGKKQFARFAFWQALGTDEEMSGIADLICFKLGYPPIAIECKAPGKVATPKQETFLDYWHRHGGRWIVASSVEAVERLLDELVPSP